MGKAERLKRTRNKNDVLAGEDRFIPGYTVQRADALRSHCVETIRALGYRAWDRGSHIVITGGPFTSPGATLGFSTISREAARVPETQWGPLVADIVGGLIASALASPPHLSKAELRRQLFPRFSAPGRISEGQLAEDYTYSRRVGGLPLLVAVRHEQASALLADIHLAKVGGVEDAWQAAEANLVAGGLGEPTAYRTPSGSTVVVFESEHPRQAAWLAYADRFAKLLGLDVGPLGMLFCVPAHRMLGIQVVTENTSLDDVERMLELTDILGEDEVAPLSRGLFWWRPGEPVVRAAAMGADGMQLSLPPTVSEVICGSVPRSFDTMDG